MQPREPKLMTAGQLADVILDAGVNPRDEEAVIVALIERGRRPEDVSPSNFRLAARLIEEGGRRAA